MRLINFFDGAESSTTPTIGNIVASNLVKYANDAAFVAAEDGAPVTGNIYYNTTDNTIRYYKGAWVELVDVSTVQTIINKDIDGNNNTITNVDGDQVIIDAISGLTAINSQDAFAEHQVEIDENISDIADSKTALGIADGATDMGTYTGSTISDNIDQAAINQELETEVELKINSSEKGANNGVAELDGSGKVPAAQLPTSLMEYEGDWNASTNTPALANTDVDKKGTVYRVSVAGTHDFGAGNITFAVGDWAYNNGTIWDKSIETTLPDTDSLPEGSGNLYYTEGRVTANATVTANTAKVSADGSIDTHSDVDTSTVAPVNGDALVFDGSDWVPGDAGGSGAGKKNYFDGGDFESNIDLATVYDDSGAYVDGNGGSPSVLSIAQNSTIPLVATNDLKISKSASDAIGEGVTLLTETIDNADLGRDLSFEMEVNFSAANYTSGDMQIKAYDVTNSAILAVIPIANLDDDAGILNAQSKIFGKVLVEPTTAVIRLSLHMTTDSQTGLAWDGFIDACLIGPNVVVPGTIAGVSTRYNSNASQTLTNAAFVILNYEDVDYDDEGSVTIGAAWKFTAPRDGKYTINASMSINNSTAWGVGEAGQMALFVDGVETISIDIYYPQATGVNVAVVLAGGVTLELSKGSYIDVRFYNGSGTNVTRSSSAGSNYIDIVEHERAGAMLSTTQVDNQSIGASTSGVTPTGTISGAYNTIIFGTVDNDDHNTYNTSTGIWIAPRSGKVDIAVGVSYANTASTGAAYLVRTRNTTTGKFFLSVVEEAGTNSARFVSGAGTLIVNKGDTIIFESLVTATSPTFSGTEAHFSIAYRPDLSTFSVYGETDFIDAGNPTAANWSASTGTWDDLTSLTLPPGEWELNAQMGIHNNGAITAQNFTMGISTTSGNSAAGLALSKNRSDNYITATTGQRNQSHINRYKVNPTIPTTYYFKGLANGNITNVQYTYYMSARRIK